MSYRGELLADSYAGGSQLAERGLVSHHHHIVVELELQLQLRFLKMPSNQYVFSLVCQNYRQASQEFWVEVD